MSSRIRSLILVSAVLLPLVIAQSTNQAVETITVS
jgi:hypothetical protein